MKTILSFVIVALLMGAVIVGYFAYKNIKTQNLMLQTEIVKFKKLTEDLVRSGTKWATRKDIENDLKKFMTKEDLDALRKDLNKLDSSLTAVGRTIGNIKGKISKLERSDKEGEEKSPIRTCKDTGDPIDVWGYTKRIQFKELKDANSAPIATTKFDASKEKPWSYEIFGRKYKLMTIVGKKESGQMTFHHQLQYSIPSVSDKLYPVNILSSEYKQAPEKNKWFWLNPKLDANFFVGGMVYKIGDGYGRFNNLLSMGLDLGVSLSSYGPNRVDSWFRLFRFGAGYNIERRAGILSFAPITFNIGKPLPLLTNLYFTPQISIDTAGGITINAGIGPQF